MFMSSGLGPAVRPGMTAWFRIDQRAPAASGALLLLVAGPLQFGLLALAPVAALVAAPEQPGDPAGRRVIPVAEALGLTIDRVTREIARHAPDGVLAQCPSMAEVAGARDADLRAAAIELLAQPEAFRGRLGDGLGRGEIDMLHCSRSS